MKFETILKYHEWYFKYHVQIVLLFVYTITRKRFVIFTCLCRYFKLSWNTTAISQSNCRNFSCSSTNILIECSVLEKLKLNASRFEMDFVFDFPMRERIRNPVSVMHQSIPAVHQYPSLKHRIELSPILSITVGQIVKT